MTSVHNTLEHASNEITNDTAIEIKMEIPDSVDDEYTIKEAPRIQPPKIISDPSLCVWTTEAETYLIKQYKKYKPLVGQTKFKSFRDMFDTIAVEMQKQGFYFSSQKCENKWRVLERKYKVLSMREMLKKPGRMKHYGRWQHKKAFDEIYNEENKNVYLEKDLIYTSDASTAKSDINQIENEISLGLCSCKTSSIIIEMKKIFENAEKNKEKRHLAKMAVFKRQLEIQEMLLKIKEHKLALKKASLAAKTKAIENIRQFV